MNGVMMMSNRETLIEYLSARNTNNGVFSKRELVDAATAVGQGYPGWVFTKDRNVRRGYYDLSPLMATTSIAPVATSLTPKMVIQPKLQTVVENLVPSVDPTYVPFGFYKDLVKVLTSKNFYPTFISGLSGNGKTTMVEQVCAKLKRECLRVNISIETDEDDLIGGNTLVDGNVVYREGPVLTAMKRGAILILDEIDRGSNKLMCLQAILEGKPYYNKKTGETIYPANGFNVIATANTKGRGSDDGKFMSAQILDDAFLERFAITVEQEYPSVKIEKKIILNKMEKANKIDEEFADKLVTWADIIRKTFYDGGVEELVSTRRLEHIVNAYAMFGSRSKAIELCVNRFDSDTKSAFLDLYSKVDAGQEELVENDAPYFDVNEEVPF
jgi:MoxR-like ATPase